MHGEHPKCLTEVDDSTILDHQLEALSLAGIHDVAIVVGYEKEQIIAHIRNKRLSYDQRIHFIENAAFAIEQYLFALGRRWLAAWRQFHRLECRCHLRSRHSQLRRRTPCSDLDDCGPVVSGRDHKGDYRRRPRGSSEQEDFARGVQRNICLNKGYLFPSCSGLRPNKNRELFLGYQGIEFGYLGQLGPIFALKLLRFPTLSPLRLEADSDACCVLPAFAMPSRGHDCSRFWTAIFESRKLTLDLIKVIIRAGICSARFLATPRRSRSRYRSSGLLCRLEVS